MHMTMRVALVSVVALLFGCGSESTEARDATVATDASMVTDVGLATVDDASPACVPDRTAWNTTVQALVQNQCGTCHGTTPLYGAPFTLLDYDADIAGAVGARRVDLMVQQMNTGMMPPASTPAPTDAIAQSIVGWASCGATMAVPGLGVRASAPLFQSPATAPAGLDFFELHAQNFPITTSLTEQYECYTFEVPVMADRFIRRFEVELDHAEVVHHLVLLSDPMHTAPTVPFECSNMPDGSEFLYAWAPGATAFQFPDGGLRVSPGDRVVLQIHYNNSAGLSGFTDTTGVRLYDDLPTGTEYGMIALGPVDFSIPAHSTGSAESACTLSAGSHMLSGTPHMHTIGTGFNEHTVHADGTISQIITLENWSFNTQLAYNIPMTYAAGDQIITHCDYNNTRDTVTTSGHLTTNEMCFNFAYFTPPPTTRFCDETEVVPGMGYVPGTCAVPAAPTDPTNVNGSIIVGTPPTLTGGAIPTGRWILSGVTYYLSSATTVAGAIDLTMSTVSGIGQAWTQPTSVTVDFTNTLGLVLGSAARFSQVIPVSFAATFPTQTTPLALTATCPSGSSSNVPTTLDYQVSATTLTAGVPPQSLAGITISPQYVFTLAP